MGFHESTLGGRGSRRAAWSGRPERADLPKNDALGNRRGGLVASCLTDAPQEVIAGIKIVWLAEQAGVLLSLFGGQHGIDAVPFFHSPFGKCSGRRLRIARVFAAKAFDGHSLFVLISTQPFALFIGQIQLLLNERIIESTVTLILPVELIVPPNQVRVGEHFIAEFIEGVAVLPIEFILAGRPLFWRQVAVQFGEIPIVLGREAGYSSRGFGCIGRRPASIVVGHRN